MREKNQQILGLKLWVGNDSTKIKKNMMAKRKIWSIQTKGLCLTHQLKKNQNLPPPPSYRE